MRTISQEKREKRWGLQIKNNDISSEGFEYMCHLLRHCPQEAGLTTDARGWIDTNALVQVIASEFPDTGFDAESLTDVVSSDEKRRFSFSYDNSKIRATYGHSVSVQTTFGPLAPQHSLFYPTSKGYLSRIRKNGIKAGSDGNVRLHGDLASADREGAERSLDIVLSIDAIGAIQAGHKFYLADDGAWLTDHVPVSCIEFGD